MNPQLQGYIDHFTDAESRMRALTSDLDDNSFIQRPPTGAWCIAEVVEHLCMFGNLILPRIDVAIEKTRARGWLGNGPVRYPFFSRLFVKAVGPLPTSKRGKMHVPKKFRPLPNQPLSETIARFVTLQRNLTARCQNADGLDIRHAVVVSAVTPLVRVRLGAWFEAIAMHQVRHFEQIEDVRAAIALPAKDAAFPQSTL